MSTRTKRLDYVAHCPTCGTKLKFGKVAEVPNMEAVRGICQNKYCKHQWSFVFDIDPSGTFGVMSFQCDDGDRILQETKQ